MPSIIDKKNRGDAVQVLGSDAIGDATLYIAVESFESERRALVQSRSYIVDGGGSNDKAGVTASGRLKVDAVMSPFPLTARPYYWWDYNVDGSTAIGADILFDFVNVQKDVYISHDSPIGVKWDSASAKSIGLPKGRFTFKSQFAGKIYITTTAITKLQIYANG